MKIKVDIDISPEEVRRLFGLPGLEAFQRQLMEDIRERLQTGVEGYDPLRRLQPSMAGSLASWDYFQRLMASLSASSAKSDDDGPR